MNAHVGDGNQALLVGEIAGLLSTRLNVELEVDGAGYTGRIFIDRPSGRYVVTVERDD